MATEGDGVAQILGLDMALALLADLHGTAHTPGEAARCRAAWQSLFRTREGLLSQLSAAERDRLAEARAKQLDEAARAGPAGREVVG